MRNGEGVDAARVASGGGVPAPGHEPLEDDQLLHMAQAKELRFGQD